MVKDPVCGCDIDETEASWRGLISDVAEETYYFCSDACKQEFDAMPDVYKVGLKDQQRATDDGMGGYPGAWE